MSGRGRESFKQRIFLVDDHPLLREGFAQLLKHQPDFQVCGQAEEPKAALEQIPAMQPDLVVVDIELKGFNGLDLIFRLRKRCPELRILALSMHDEALYAQRALRAGARGYVMKQAEVEELLGAMRKILRGEQYVSPRMHERLLKTVQDSAAVPPAAELKKLSRRELEVFQMLGQGTATRDIAADLGLSVKTIETYRAHIMQKLNLEDGMELVHYAIKVAQEEDRKSPP